MLLEMAHALYFDKSRKRLYLCSMIAKTKKSVSLPNSLLNELALLGKDKNISEFIEKALIHYINELKRKERGQRDIAIINANAKRFNKEAEENLEFQAII